MHELVEVDGLGDIVDGPCLHGLHGRLDRPVGGHHDDVDLGVELLHLLEDLETVHAGHLVVHEEQVEIGRTDFREGLFAGVCLGHRVAFLAQEVPEHLPLDLPVFNDQYAEFFHILLHGESTDSAGRCACCPWN